MAKQTNQNTVRINKKKKKRARARNRKLFLLALVVCALALGAWILFTVLGDGYELENENDPVATVKLKGGKEIIVELFPDAAPNTVNNFISLANAGFYDGKNFDRLLAGDRIYAGDSTGDGTGGAGYCIKGEFALNGFEGDGLGHTRGTLSMARMNGYDTASSQFFILLSDAPYLNGGYAAFGRVVKGIDVLDALSRADVDEALRPLSERVTEAIRGDAKGDGSEVEKRPPR